MWYYCDSPLVLIITWGWHGWPAWGGGGRYSQTPPPSLPTVSTQLTRPQAGNRPTVRIAGPFTDHSPGYYLKAPGSQVGERRVWRIPHLKNIRSVRPVEKQIQSPGTSPSGDNFHYNSDHRLSGMSESFFIPPECLRWAVAVLKEVKKEQRGRCDSNKTKKIIILRQA